MLSQLALEHGADIERILRTYIELIGCEHRKLHVILDWINAKLDAAFASSA